MRETERISPTRASMRFAVRRARARYLSRSRYTPTPSSMPPSWPFRMVTGVFSSWEAAAKKASRRRSSARARSMSSRRAALAAFSSARAAERRPAISSRLRPSRPISSGRLSPHFHWKSSSAIFPAMALMRTMGFAR